jgi:D-glycero-D-manno-heptose 1,7-bisphosphate phosphatase
MSIKNKIKTREELSKLCQVWKTEGKKVGFTSGAFDILHAGHASYLEKAKAKADILIVGLNSDSSVKEYKDESRPINPEKARLTTIAALESVDYVFLFNETKNRENLEALKPDFYIKAGDYSPESLTSKDVVEKYGGKALIIPFEKGFSTTNIIKKIKTLDGAEEIPFNKPDEKQKAIFLDRDGVINVDKEYLHEPQQFELEKNVAKGIKIMQDMGYKLIVITNQGGIGLGYYTKEDFYKVNREMFKQLGKNNINIDKVYFCPHMSSEECTCRKPKTGMITRGQEELNLDLKKCFVIGDKTADIKAGNDSGCKTILVKTGHKGKDNRYKAKPTYIADDLLDSANYIKENFLGGV